MAGHQLQMDSNRHPSSTPIDQVSTALPSVAADESDSDLSNSSSCTDVKEHNTSNVKQDYYSTDTSVDDRTRENSRKYITLLTVPNVDEIDTTTTATHKLNASDKPVTLPSYMLNFECPKSGCDRLSWNALPLAINSSFLSKRMQLILRIFIATYNISI